MVTGRAPLNHRILKYGESSLLKKKEKVNLNTV